MNLSQGKNICLTQKKSEINQERKTAQFICQNAVYLNDHFQMLISLSGCMMPSFAHYWTIPNNRATTMALEDLLNKADGALPLYHQIVFPLHPGSSKDPDKYLRQRTKQAPEHISNVT